MSSTPIKRNKKCPYWLNKVKKCQISGGGLFIPQDDHNEIYCTASNYPQCLQYVLHSENQLELIEAKNSLLRNRRKHIRISASHKITLNKILKSDEPVAALQATAKTLDVGVGGIRLAIDFPLENRALVHLYFDDSFPQNLQSATGQVTWCNKQIDEPGYHAGISFKSDRIIEAMERHFRK